MILLDCMKALYIGAGTDVIPQNTFKHIKDWICVDSEPCQNYRDRPSRSQNDKNCNMRYVHYLHKIYEEIGFTMIHQNTEEHKVVFVNVSTGQTVTYYYNHPYSDKYCAPEVAFHIETSDALVVKGYIPHACLLEKLKKDIPMICANNTVYEWDKDDEVHTIVAPKYLSKLKSHISEYVLVNTVPFNHILYGDHPRHIRANEVAQWVTLGDFEGLKHDKIKKHFKS